MVVAIVVEGLIMNEVQNSVEVRARCAQLARVVSEASESLQRLWPAIESFFSDAECEISKARGELDDAEYEEAVDSVEADSWRDKLDEVEAAISRAREDSEIAFQESQGQLDDLATEMEPVEEEGVDD
jgi:hypothetical protein